MQRNTFIEIANVFIHDCSTHSTIPSPAICRSPENFLRGAAKAIERAGTGNDEGCDADAGDKEVSALKEFAQEVGFILPQQVYADVFARGPIRPGAEHFAIALVADSIVLKDYNTKLIDENSGEMAFKPTDRLFDYLTDHLLSNHFFGDNVELQGFYEDGDAFHLVISQPYVKGRHLKDKSKFVRQLEAQRLVAAHGDSNRFWIDGGNAGNILITDLHEDNAIFGHRSRLLHPIDVHYKFTSRAARILALNALGIY